MTTIADRVGATASPKWPMRLGWLFSALPPLMMAFSASLKFSHSPQVVRIFTEKLGYQESALSGIGILEIACATLYVIPRTAVLGAVLVTGYLGGAVATHVRVSDPFIAPLMLGICAWIGLYLRDARVRAILPLR